jgi:BirA family biotin operon repressor/biotin-[acetyl-CoA-carboxylase] ligase
VVSQSPARIDATRLASLLGHDCRLAVKDSATTTNDEVLAFAAGLADTGAFDGEQPFVVVSARQTAGRGRLGRTWASPPGGVYLSVLLGDWSLKGGLGGLGSRGSQGGDLRDGRGLQGGRGGQGGQGGQPLVGSVASLSPLAALAVRGALQPLTSQRISIKWPNDLITEGGKLVGVLVEMKPESRLFAAGAQGASGAHGVSRGHGASKGHGASAKNGAPSPSPSSVFVVGVGINVSRPEEGGFDGAAYLEDGAEGVRRLEDVAAAAIDGFLDYRGSWLAAGCSFSPFVAEYHEHMALLGSRVCVRDASGKEVASGVVRGIDDEARLLLAGPQGVVTAVAAGEVTLRDS